MAISKKKILFTVTNDLSFDQRMHRICSSLSKAGYQVLLVGRSRKDSTPLLPQSYQQKRLFCFFQKGKFFYIEYNIRLFFYLLFKKIDCIGAIDLDTILPCYFISVLKNTRRVYDAHELFCEMKEIVTRPSIYTVWKKIEKYTVPKFSSGYTVNQQIADEFYKMYGLQYSIIKNTPLKKTIENIIKREKYILYQGAVNEGRCFESLIPAMKDVPVKLLICGNGNFMEQAVALVKQHQLEDKIIFKGNIQPDELLHITRRATIGINLVENNGLSNYLSLANKFFDYMHAVLPQICIGFPAYTAINDIFGFAQIIVDTSSKNIAAELNNLLQNEVLCKKLEENCLIAREVLNWQEEEKKLLAFYGQLL
jgi:glycosyltransferase involved in cell wall biosynthesis